MWERPICFASRRADLIRAKLNALEHEISVFLPTLANECGLDPGQTHPSD